MSVPTDEALYNKVKAEVDKTYTKPSAYRSMAYTRFYLKEFRDKYGDSKKAYRGKNPGDLEGWRKEKWIDVKSFLNDPKNPTACGNEPYKKGEYPLCMPRKEASKYSRGELELLVQRKSELGKKRLVKDAYLRDVLNPEETPAVRKYKDKYQTDKKLKLPKPLPQKEAERILAEPPIVKEKKKPSKKTKEMTEEVQEVTVPTLEKPEEAKPKRGRGRPRLSEEAKQRTKQAALERRKQRRKQESAGKEEERKQAKQQKAQEREQRQRELEQEKLRQRQEREANQKPTAPEGPASPEEWEEYRRKKVAYDQRLKDRNNATPSVTFDRGTRVITFA